MEYLNSLQQENEKLKVINDNLIKIVSTSEHGVKDVTLKDVEYLGNYENGHGVKVSYIEEHVVVVKHIDSTLLDDRGQSAEQFAVEFATHGKCKFSE